MYIKVNILIKTKNIQIRFKENILNSKLLHQTLSITLYIIINRETQNNNNDGLEILCTNIFSACCQSVRGIGTG